MALTVKKSAVVALLVSCGLKTAGQYTDKQLQDKIKVLPKAVDEDTDKVKDPAQMKLLKSILKAVNNKEEVALEDDTKGAKTAPKAEKKEEAKSAAKKPAAKAPEPEEEEESEEEEEEADEEDAEEEEEESEDEEMGESEEEEEEESEEEEEKPKAKKTEKPKAEKKGNAPPKKVGVISTILQCLGRMKDGKPVPVSKDFIVQTLVKKFPDREEKAMRSTVNSQVPSGLKTEKNITLKKTEDGKFYLEKADREKWVPAK